jgi:FtsP/CotA-like multicopper oxidase with cupredoxin domain
MDTANDKETSMRIKKQHASGTGALLLAIAAWLGFASLDLGAALAGTLPAATCTVTGPGARTCELWAKTGAITLAGYTGTMPVWGYASSADGPAQLPGPPLIVNEGETVTVILHNTLAANTGLLFQGQELPPDLGGVAGGGVATYTFAAVHAGTYLYEAGLLPNSQHQVAMGLFGALIVRPAVAGQAYAGVATAYADEALVILSEIDPALNTSADPASFDMRGFAPRYRLIGGKAYPDTDPVDSAPGNRLLLRYVNAGIQHHSMSALGLNQTVVAHDGSPLQYPYSMAAETLAPGQTLDTIITIPANADPGSKFALFDGSLRLRNSNTAGYGGMLAFIGTAGSTSNSGGPAASAVTVTPSPTNGQVAVSLTASISDAASGNGNVAAAEYFVDAVGANGAGIAMSGSFGSPTVSVSATIPAATLATLAAGNHTFYVHGQDADGNWGAVSSAVMVLDKSGPTTSGLILNPNPSNGSVDVTISATADDSASGNSIVTAAEYFIDSAGASGTGTALALNLSAPIVSLTGTIPVSTLAGLSAGVHRVYVHGRDGFMQWGPLASADLTIQTAGPSAGAVGVSPNPNSGSMGINSTSPVVRVTATFTDTASNISTAEGFLDATGAAGTGFPLIAVDGIFNSGSEPAYGDIPLTTIGLLPEGLHTIYVHGRNSAGNWGAFSSVVLMIDKSNPTVSGLAFSPNPTNTTLSNNVGFTLTATATDPSVNGVSSNIAAAEWYEGADPGAGNGTAMTGAFLTSPTVAISATINFVTLGWTPGNHTLYVRAKDASNHWSASVSIVVNVVMPNTIFADSFESGNFNAWNGGTSGPGLSVTTAARMTAGGTYGMQVGLGSGTTPRYVADSTPNQETAYHARFYFNPHGVLTGNNQVVTIFAGMNAANTAIFQVQMRRQNAGGIYQVRLSVLRAGGTTNTNYFTISNAAHAIEVVWQSAGNASASLSIDGVVRQTLNGLNTNAYQLDSVRLGPSLGLLSSASGTMYFDAFASTRRSVIGP